MIRRVSMALAVIAPMTAAMIAACGGGAQRDPVIVSPATSASAGGSAGGVDADAGAGGAGAAGASSKVPPGFRGAFHLPGHIDSINLVLESDGTFRWRIFGCDFGGGGAGEWHTTAAGPTMIELVPAGGAPSFPWMDKSSFVHPATKITLRVRLDGGLDAAAAGTTPSDAWLQRWDRGRVCAQCGGGLGPDKMPKPCSDPLPPAGSSSLGE